MKEKITELEKCFKGTNKYSKYIMKTGCAVIFAVYFAAMLCISFAGRGADYYDCMFWFNELTVLGKDFLGVFFVLPLVIDILVRAEEFDRRG